MTITSVCVCGSGTMGSGIAQVAAAAGYRVIMYDMQDDALTTASSRIEHNLQKLLDKEKLTQTTKKDILYRIHFTSLIDECKADLIIEAIVENLESKVSLFTQLALLNPGSILASNTSSLPITNIAEQLSIKERVIGLHFFNPAPLMRLVEVVKTRYTAEDVIHAVLAFTKSLNKVSVICSDAPGFIVNRVARPYYIEALRMLEEGTATIETIDKLLEAQGFRMGPFKLMDLIGNDINYAVSCSVYEQLGNPERLKPSAIQKERVDKGELGRKTGRGYYDYR